MRVFHMLILKMTLNLAFVAQQRNRFKKGTLSEEKQKILESLSGWLCAPKSKSTREIDKIKV